MAESTEAGHCPPACGSLAAGTVAVVSLVVPAWCLRLRDAASAKTATTGSLRTWRPPPQACGSLSRDARPAPCWPLEGRPRVPALPLRPTAMNPTQFRNDGSFMEEFMAMQKNSTAAAGAGSGAPAAAALAAAAPAAAPAAAAPGDLLKNDGNFMEKFLAMQPAAAVPAGQATSTVPAPANSADARPSRPVKPSRQPKQAKPEVAAIFSAVEDDEPDPLAAEEDIPASTKKAIENCAGWVVQHGEAFEQTLKTKNAGNPTFQFLFDSACKEAAYYRQVLQDKRTAIAAEQARAEARSTKRASRWGSARVSTSAALTAGQASMASSGPAPPFDPVAAAIEAAKAVAARLSARAAMPASASGESLSETTGKRKFSEVAGPQAANDERSHSVPRLQHELDPHNAGRGIVPVPDLQYALSDHVSTRLRARVCVGPGG